MTDVRWWLARSGSGGRQDRSERAAPPVPPGSSVLAQCSDVELAHRLSDADGAALVELYQRFGRLCYSLARRICADDGLAEDVVHEVFLMLWRDPRRFDPVRGSFATWLVTAIHHTAVDTVRQRTATDRAAVEEWSRPPVAGTDQVSVARVAANQVSAVLDRLPGEQRQVLVGAYFGGRTLHEIAACTGVPLGTVKSRLLAGVQRVQSLLTERLGPDALVAEAYAVWKVSQ